MPDNTDRPTRPSRSVTGSRADIVETLKEHGHATYRLCMDSMSDAYYEAMLAVESGATDVKVRTTTYTVTGDGPDSESS